MPQTATEQQDDAANPRIKNRELIRKVTAAYEAGDDETADKYLRQMYYSAEDLEYLRDVLGRDYIERIGMDTTPAEEKYGKDWLDQTV